MKRYLSLFFIGAFIGITAFGVSFMSHDSGVIHDSCLSGGVFNVDCVQGMGSFLMIMLHSSALTQLSSATFSGLPDVAIISVFIGSLFVLLGLGTVSDLASFAVRYTRDVYLVYSEYERQLVSWLALHGKRDFALLDVLGF